MNKELAIYVGTIGVTITAITAAIVLHDAKNKKDEQLKYDRNQAELAVKRAHELNLEKIKAEKELEEKKIMASMPDSYWAAKKAEEEEKTKQVQAKLDAEIKKLADKLEAEKNMPAGYFERETAIEKAKIEADATVQKAKAEAEATMKKAEEERKAAIEKAEREAETSRYVADRNNATALEQSRINRHQMESAINGATALLGYLK